MMRRLLPLLLLASCAGLPNGDEANLTGSLGVLTAAPTESDALEYALPQGVRTQGRVILSVLDGSAADRLGLEPGGIILSLDSVDLFSEDDLNDVLTVNVPGSTVSIAFHPPSDRDVIETEVMLDIGAPRAPDAITWQFASLGQMERAVELATTKKRRILVGLSGAET